MMIYGEIDHRLDSVVKFDTYVDGKPYLLVIHPHDVERWIEDELPARINHIHCRGILVVKGVPQAGISDGQYQRLKELFGSRLHVSARAVGTAQEDTRLSGARAARFGKFFQYARSKDVLDWNILDPPWPESIVAVYLLARVMSADARARKVIENRRPEWELIWEEAKREYKSLTQRALNYPSLDSDTAEKIATHINQYFTEIELSLPSELSQERGRLRHLWLKNQVLALNEDFVVLMHGKRSLQKARESFESKIQPDGEFTIRLNDARRLVQQMLEGFSPAQLVDLGPLEQLSKDARRQVKSVSHDLYLRKTAIAELSESLTGAITDLANALQEFTTTWFEQPTAHETLIRSRFAHFQLCAQALQEKLGRSPEGIVLP